MCGAQRRSKGAHPTCGSQRRSNKILQGEGHQAARAWQQPVNLPACAAHMACPGAGMASYATVGAGRRCPSIAMTNSQMRRSRFAMPMRIAMNRKRNRERDTCNQPRQRQRRWWVRGTQAAARGHAAANG
eukprot:364068-Chlamydomonas_euryale.AAC.3